MLIVLTTIFIFVAAMLCLVVLFLQGKGDLGVIGAWQSGQVVFGGSGGQDFIGKTVWVLGILFLLLSFLVAKAEVKYRVRTVLDKQYSESTLPDLKESSLDMPIEPKTESSTDGEKE